MGGAGLDAGQFAGPGEARARGVDLEPPHRDFRDGVAAPDNFHLVAVRIGQADAPAAARIVHILDGRGAIHR